MTNVKYTYDIMPLDGDWGENDMYDLADSGKRGWKVVSIQYNPETKLPFALIERAYTGKLPDGNWSDCPELD